MKKEKGKMAKNKGLLNPCGPKPIAVVAASRDIPEAVSRPSPRRVVVPRTPAQHKRAPSLCTPLFLAVIRAFILGTCPFPNIAGGIVQAEWVCCKGANWGSSAFITVTTLPTIGIIRANLIAPPILGFGTGTSGIFPLCLGW